jgi:hypothetical protein
MAGLDEGAWTLRGQAGEVDSHPLLVVFGSQRLLETGSVRTTSRAFDVVVGRGLRGQQWGELFPFPKC